MTFEKNMVVQFNESHKWCGCLGIVSEVKPEKVMVGVPMPQNGTAYIFCKHDDVVYIGLAALTAKESSDDT